MAVSVIQVAKSLGAKTASDIARNRGVKWPPPPAISLRSLLLMARAKIPGLVVETVRDQVLLDDTFAQRIKAGITANNLDPGSTIVLAARQFTFGPNYTFALPGFNLLILADTFDSVGGAIDVSGQNGSNGAAGAPGVDASNSLSGAGGSGASGDNGTSGTSGTNVTLFCRTLMDARILTNGGSGGNGGYGGDGGGGGRGDPGRPPNPREGDPGSPSIQGGRGGDGGWGGNGGLGGNAGQVTIVFMTDGVPGGFNPKQSIQQNRGVGGRGGTAGRGAGSGFDAGPPGQDGSNGPNGPDGADGVPVLLQVDQLTFFDLIRTFSQMAQQWADYRLKVGQFFFRLFRPGTQDGKQNFDLALGEFDSVLSLTPQSADASQLRTWLLNNRNIFGIPRDLDLLPNFPEYESVVHDYSGLVADVFSSATYLLSQNVLLDQKRQDLAARILSLNELLSALNYELSLALSGLDATNAEKKLADLRLQHANDALNEANQAAEMKMAWGVLLTLGIVCAASIGIAAGGSTLLAALPALIDGGGKISSGAIISLNGYTADLTSLSTSAEALAKLKSVAGGLKDAIDGVKGVYDIAKLDHDLLNAQADPSILALARQVQECVIAQLAAKLHVEQAQYAVNAAQARLQRAQNDIQRAETQLAGLSDTIAVLMGAARTLINNAQGAMDTLTKYAFYAARSLEIYTLTDLRSQVRYDYGYIHPDLDLDLVASDIAQGLGADKLVKAYNASWSQFVNVVQYRDQYEQYLISGNVVSDFQYLTFNDPALIAAFRQRADLLFFIAIADILPKRYETKVTSVTVSLVGAKANAPAISCIVEHSGRYTQIKRDGSRVDMSLGPRPTIVQAAKTAEQFSGSVEGNVPELPFWGRGLASSWHLYIENAEITQKGVDLSALSKIQIAIGYDAFFVQ